MKIKDVIFCDDIRRELNNKFSLMGLYSDRIVIRSRPESEVKWPVTLQLATLIRIELEKTDLFDRFEFRYLNNEKELVMIEGAASPKKGQSFFNINLVAQLPIEKGPFGFRITIFNRDSVVFEETQSNAIRITQEDVAPDKPLFA